jgi:HK97 family phage prohead protease
MSEESPSDTSGNVACKLKLTADTRALTAEITPDGTTWGADAQRSIEAGTVSGSSFAFRTKTDNWYRQGCEWRRDLEDVDLIEVSPVASPTYTLSTATTAESFRWLRSFPAENGKPSTGVCPGGLHVEL